MVDDNYLGRRVHACLGRLGQVHPRRRTPTLAMGLICIGFLLAMNMSGKLGKALMTDSFTALNLLVAFYYVLTAFACVRSVEPGSRGWREMAAGVWLPMLGGVLLTLALVATTFDLAEVGKSDTSFGRVGGPPFVGIGRLVLGIAIALCYRPWAREYFSEQTLRRS